MKINQKLDESLTSLIVGEVTEISCKQEIALSARLNCTGP